PTGNNSRIRLDDIESRNFILEEEVKDLRIQLSSKQNELNKTLELTKLENNEKMKKLKGIFNDVNKKLTELRQTVVTKDSEIEELKKTMENLKEKDEKSKSSVDEKSIEKLTTELHSQASTYNAQIEQLESKLRQTTQQNTSLKSEFQQYKARAHSLLEQKNLSINNNIIDIDSVAELNYSQEKIRVLERDLKQSLKRNGQLEKEFGKSQQVLKENVKVIRTLQENYQSLLEENEKLKKSQRETEEQYKSNVNDFNDRFNKSTELIQKSLKQKQEENDQLQSILENRIITTITTTNITTNTTNINSTGKIQSMRNHHVRRESSRSSSPSSPHSRPNSIYNSLSDLLADTEERASTLSDKEQDYALKLQHMAEMLNESEVHVQRLMEQEKILKEEIRKLDRLEKRQDLNIEYLKNVVLKFFETDSTEREHLIPVISTVLQLSPEETLSLKDNSISNFVVDDLNLLLSYQKLSHSYETEEDID
ncbi:5236_t:CDS:10, partial [Diversispora eburnea]